MGLALALFQARGEAPASLQRFHVSGILFEALAKGFAER